MRTQAAMKTKIDYEVFVKVCNIKYMHLFYAYLFLSYRFGEGATTMISQYLRKSGGSWARAVESFAFRVGGLS